MIHKVRGKIQMSIVCFYGSIIIIIAIPKSIVIVNNK